MASDVTLWSLLTCCRLCVAAGNDLGTSVAVALLPLDLVRQLVATTVVVVLLLIIRVAGMTPLIIRSEVAS